MGWFNEQLKNRKKSDEEHFEETLLGIASSVLGKNLSSALSNNKMTHLAISSILNYYHIKIDENTELPDKFNSPEDEVNFLCRPHGILHREVELKKGWYRCAFGPMLGTLKEGNQPVAIIPNKTFGYSFYNIKTGKKTSINHRTVKLLSEQATYFYRPFPLRKLHIIDLIKFMISQVTISDIVIYLLLSIITMSIGLTTPLFTKWLFGYILDQKNITLLISLATFMISFSLAQLLFRCFKDIIDSRVGTKIGLATETAVMQRILSLSPAFFKNYSAGELSVHARQLISLCNTLIFSIIIATVEALLSFMYIGEVGAFAPSLIAPSLIVTLINVVFSLVVAYASSKRMKKKLNLSAKEKGMSYAMITGIQKIKLSGSEKRMFSRWGDLFIKSSKLEYNPPLFLKISSSLSFLITSAGTIVIYYIAIRNNVSVSNYYAFTAAFGMISSALVSLADIATTIGTIMPTYKMAKPILDAIPETNENKLCLDALHGSIELNNVSFRYNDDMPLVIDNLSLKINPGDYIAIVGQTGCGKSTLVRLLLGFEKPQKGAIYYDKNDVNSVDLQSLRQKIGTVMQNSKLFNSDIYSNITISAPWVDEAGAWKAAHMASIDEDIRNMPMGMHTIISEGQGGISGGQRQRLAIARAIAGDPRILIFDEATSALDNITQKKVSDAIDSLKCTRIVIAHRLTTIKNCSRIIVLDKGHVVEDGTYDKLIAKNGFFAELVKRQRLDIETE